MAGHDELLDHEYDGITEYDNPLPRWWLWMFYISIIFAVVYTPYIMFGFGPSSSEEYQQEVAEAQKRHPALANRDAPPPTNNQAAAVATTPSLEGNAEAIAAGKAIYAASCAPCHGANGEGVIGPNLTDKFWLHGNTYADITRTISEGVPDKGMVPWKAILSPAKIGQTSAYIISLKGSNPPNAKAPQGKEYAE